MYRKIIILSISILLIGSFGCNKKELEELQQENEKLSEEIKQKNSKIEKLENYLAKIENNLQSMIESKSPGDVSGLDKVASGKLKKRLDEVNALVQETKEKREDFDQQLSGARYQANKYKKEADKLKKELKVQEDSLQSITKDLEKKVDKIKEMTETVDEQKSEIEKLAKENEAYLDSLKKQTEILNTAYVAVNENKELENKNIIKKEGGFLGFLGQTWILNPNFKNADFKTVDITEDKTVTIEAKKRKAEFVTTHPKGSYTLKEEGDNKTVLEITDPEKFWKTGNYLVIAY